MVCTSGEERLSSHGGAGSNERNRETNVKSSCSMRALALALQGNSQIPLLTRSVAPATNSKFGARVAQDQMRQNVRIGR